MSMEAGLYLRLLRAVALVHNCVRSLPFRGETRGIKTGGRRGEASIREKAGWQAFSAQAGISDGKAVSGEGVRQTSFRQTVCRVGSEAGLPQAGRRQEDSKRCHQAFGNCAQAPCPWHPWHLGTPRHRRPGCGGGRRGCRLGEDAVDVERDGRH